MSAQVIYLLQRRRADYELATALLNEAAAGEKLGEQGDRLAALRALQQANLAMELFYAVTGRVDQPPPDQLARWAFDFWCSTWPLRSRLRSLVKRLRPRGLVPGQVTRYGHPRNLQLHLAKAPRRLRAADAANDLSAA